MSDLLRLIVLRDLRINLLRSSLTILAIACGIALFSSIQILNESTLRFFSTSVRAMSGGASLSVTGFEGGLPERLVDTALGARGVLHAVPIVKSPVYVRGASKHPAQAMVLYGIDVRQETSVRSYQFANKPASENPLLLLKNRDSIFVTGEYAGKAGLEAGSRVEMLTKFGTHRFTVAGTLSPVGPAVVHGGNVVFMDIDAAQRLFGAEEKVSRIDLVTDGEHPPDELIRDLEHVLGPGVRVHRPESGIHDMQRMVSGYQRLLSFIGVLALIGGGLVLASAVSMFVTEHHKDIGIMRALGAGRTTIFRIVETEALVIGLLGSAAGVAAGRLLAALLVDHISSTMSNQYLVPIVVSELAFSSVDIVMVVALGTLLSAATALWAAYRAIRLDTVNAMRPTEIADAARQPVWLAMTGRTGISMLLFVAVFSFFRPAMDITALQSLNAVLAFLASLAIAPWLVVHSLRSFRFSGAGRALSDRFATLRLALGNVLGQPGRTGANVLVLSISLILIVTVSTVQGSFQKSMERRLDRILYADLIISSPGRRPFSFPKASSGISENRRDTLQLCP